MDKWKVLGIERTKDKRLIKNAYREKITIYNPEDDAEGFQRLRGAYEAAMKEADKEDEIIIDKSPVSVWMEKVYDNYNDFSSRINENSWRMVLDDDVCIQLDTSEEAGNSLLEFLMDKYNLPNSIIKIFDECFNWSDKENELKQVYPENFINFVMFKIYGEENLRYELFNIEDGKDYDEYIYLYNELLGHVNNYREEASEVIKKINKLHIDHVDMSILYTRYYLQNNEIGKAAALVNEILEDYKDDSAYYIAAQVEFNLGAGHIEKAKEYYEEVLKYNENNAGAIKGIADCLSELGSYEEASEKYDKALDLIQYNDYLMESRRNNDLKLIEKYKKMLEEEETNELKFKLAWLQIRAYEYTNALETANKIDALYDEAQYYDLLGVINWNIDNFKEALDSFTKFKNVNTDESKEHYICLQIGRQLEFLDKLEDALEMYNRALELDVNDTEVKYRKCMTLNRLNRLRESINLCDEVLEKDKNNARVHFCKGECLYKLGEFKESIESLDTCINIFPYFIDAYLIEIKIYCEAERYEDAMYLINKAEEYKIENKEIKLHKAKVLRNMEKYDECIKLCEELLKEEGNNSEVYYELALLSRCKFEFIGALKYIDMAINEDGNNISNYYLRMDLNKHLSQYKDALRDADMIINLDNSEHRIYARKGEIYYELQDYKKCIECYIKALEIDPNNDEYYNLLGIAYENDANYNKAFNAYKKSIELNPSQGYAYRNLADIYGIRKDFNNRIECLKKQMEFNNDYEFLYNEIASAYLNELKDYTNAIEYYNKYIELNSENEHVQSSIAYCYYEIEEYEKSKKHFEKCIEISSDNQYAYLCLGGLYEDVFKNYEKAIEYYEKLSYLNPETEDIYTKLGLCYFHLGEYNESIKSYRKQMKISGETDSLYNEIGKVYELHLKDYGRALENYNKVLRINAIHNEAYRNIADCYVKLEENYPEAIRNYKIQGKLYGDKRTYSLNIAEIYEKMGKMIRAKRHYKKAINFYLKLFDIDDTHSCNYNRIGRCYSKIGEYDKAEESFLKAIQLELDGSKCYDCECHSSYYEICKLYLKRDDLKRALEYIEKAIEIKQDEKYLKAKLNIQKVFEK